MAERIEIELPVRVSEDWALNSFGSFQHTCRNAAGAELLLNLSAVTWIDPLPVAAITAELDRCLGSGSISRLQIQLGEWGTSDAALLAGRTRKFLATMGFFTCLSGLRGKAEILYLGHADEVARIVPAKDAPKIKVLVGDLLSERSAPLLYDDVVLVPITLVRRISQAQEATIDRLVNMANSAYFRGSRSRLAARDSTLQRLRAVLDELVRNALEHGYRDPADTESAAVLFVRVRRPLAKKPLESDLRGTPRLRRRLPGDVFLENDDQTERIEQYVCDVGIGVLSDFEIWRQAALTARGIGDSERNAIKNADHEEAQAKLLFRYPVSRFSNPQASEVERMLRGQTTGLVYLDKVLGYPGDVSCLYTASSRVFGRHRFEASGGATHHRRRGEGGQAIRGTLVRVSLRIHNPTEMPSGWFVPERNPATCQEVAQATAKHAAGLGDDLEIIDLRSSPSGPLFRKPTAQTLFSERNVLVRLSRSAGKNDLMRVLESWLTTAGEQRAGTGTRLLAVTDMSRSQARHLHTALLGPRDSADPGFPAKDKVLTASRRGRLLGTIMLVTEDLAIAVLEVRSAPSGRHPYTLHQYSVETMDPQEAAPDLRRRFQDRLVRLLLTLSKDDSESFWRRVIEDTANGQTLLLGPVKWWTDGDEYQTLPVYLDFRAALQVRELARIVRKALRRVLALFPGGLFVAMDKLVEGELRDAMRWSQSGAFFDSDSTKADLLERVLQDNRLVLVGSVGVSGATRDRFTKGSASRPQTVECFHRSSGGNAVSGLSALQWIEDAGIDYQAVLAMRRDVSYERERDTPYVHRVKLTPPSVPSVVSFAPPSTEPRRQWPSETYAAFARDNLLRMGHWQFGGRHSLLESNTPLAIDHFVASGQGFFPWLLAEVTRCCTNRDSAWVVVYPAHRSVDKIVRVLRSGIENTNLHQAPSFLPLQMIPGVAGGITRLSDLSLARLEEIRGRELSERPLSAIFVDVGFIDKRTLREVRRQLGAVRVPVVKALAVTNRSNSPAFPAEDDERAVQGYWRWNVPILGHVDQCPLCSGLRSLDYLGQALRAQRRDLLPALLAVQKRWKVSSLQDDWWEEGIEPFRLPVPLELRMGYTEDEVFAREPSFRPRRSPQTVRWHFVKHEHSVGVLAHYVEIARYTGNGTLLLDKVRSKPQLLDLPPLALIECLAGYLAICGPTLAHWQRVAYVEEVVKQLFRHQSHVASWSEDPDSTESAERVSDVLGLASLVALNLDKRTKLACRRCVITEVKKYVEQRSSEGRSAAVGPEARLLLIGLGEPAPTGIREDAAPISDLFEGNDQRTRKRIIELLDSITLVSRTRRSLWVAFDDRLGSRDQHDGQIARSMRSTSGSDASGACDALATLLGGATSSFLSGLDFEEGSVDHLIEDLGRIGMELLRADGRTLVDAVHRASAHLDLVRRKYQSKLLRCAESGDNVATTWERWFKTSGAFPEGEDPFLSMPRQLAFVRVGAKWTGGTHYLPLCRHLQEVVVDTIRNALSNAIEPFVHPGASVADSAMAWIDVSQTETGVQLTVVNVTAKGKTLVTEQESAPCLNEIGGSILRRARSSDAQIFYEVLINIPWLQTIAHEELEAAK